jgi:hypothetical protein
MEDAGRDYKSWLVKYHQDLREAVKKYRSPQPGDSTNFAMATLGQELLNITEDFEQKYGSPLRAK